MKSCCRRPERNAGWCRAARADMYYRIAADAMVVIHLAFIGFVLFGGLSVFRWPRIVVVHVPAVVWAVLLELYRLPCPLTPWEQQLRLVAGEAGYSGGFITHYLLPLIYPDGLTRNVQLVLAGVVLAVNGSVYGWLARKRWTARRTGVKQGNDSTHQG
jgi:Protein of Unknown function (DUF2784)